MTNFDKVKEMWTIEKMLQRETICDVVHELREEDICLDRHCYECRAWLAQEYKELILDDVEKEYLAAVIKPFKNRVKCIAKEGDELGEYIRINLYGNEWINLPYFKKDTMYKGMKYKEYSLKELGLE